MLNTPILDQIMLEADQKNLDAIYRPILILNYAKATEHIFHITNQFLQRMSVLLDHTQDPDFQQQKQRLMEDLNKAVEDLEELEKNIWPV